MNFAGKADFPWPITHTINTIYLKLKYMLNICAHNCWHFDIDPCIDQIIQESRLMYWRQKLTAQKVERFMQMK